MSSFNIFVVANLIYLIEAFLAITYMGSERISVRSTGGAACV